MTWTEFRNAGQTTHTMDMLVDVTRPKSIEEIPHGNFSTYTNWACRCDECRAAATAYKRHQQVERKARMAEYLAERQSV